MGLLSRYRELRSHKKDTEDKQAILRVVIIATVLVYSVGGYLAGEIRFETVIFVGFVFLFSIAILADIFRSPDINELRRYISIIHDPFVLTWFLHLAQGRASLYLFVYTWVAIGNGFRYGPKYLYVSAGLGAIGFSSLLILDPYWTTHWYFGLGVLVTIMAVAGYTGMLLTQLKKAKQKLEELATRDPLTGLANRALLLERARASLAQNSRQNREMGTLYFDLDGFKKVNDDFGHKAGDDLLVEVATQVKACIRESDTFARIGGDEFVIILDSLHSHHDLKVICDRVSRAIHGINIMNGHPIQISSSIGVIHITSEANAPKLTAENLIKLADEQMYKAKKAGKNRIEYKKLEAA